MLSIKNAIRHTSKCRMSLPSVTTDPPKGEPETVQGRSRMSVIKSSVTTIASKMAPLGETQDEKALDIGQDS